jgi:hypothetical protein
MFERVARVPQALMAMSIAGHQRSALARNPGGVSLGTFLSLLTRKCLALSGRVRTTFLGCRAETRHQQIAPVGRTSSSLSSPKPNQHGVCDDFFDWIPALRGYDEMSVMAFTDSHRANQGTSN